MRFLVGTVVLFAGLTVLTALTQPRLAPGMALLGLARALRALGAVERFETRALDLLAAYLAVWALGLCYLLSAFVAAPTTGTFWVLFGTVAAIVLPAALLARRHFADSPAGGSA